MYNPIIKNIKKLLKDRKYEYIDTFYDTEFDSDERELIWIIAKYNGKHILIHLSKLLKSFKSTDIKATAKFINSSDKLSKLHKTALKYIFIIDKKKTTFPKLLLNFKKAFFKKVEVELISKENLEINPIDHIITPKYRLLSEEEVSKFEDNSTCKKKHILKMIESDPISVWYGAKRGDIFEIIISNSIVGLKQIKYRRIISNE